MVGKPWLWLPPQWTHALTPSALNILSRFYPPDPLAWRSFYWKGLHFPNPLGPAGGVDKNAVNVNHWQNLGAGFCETGTVTPLPQEALPGKNLDRSLKHRSLWNHLGFPNRGLSFVEKRLTAKNPKRAVPLFINIGKNRSAGQSSAHRDYVKLLQALHPFADAFVINISSPNTKGLRDIFDENRLSPFLRSLKSALNETPSKKPLILKLSPDLEDSRFLRIIDQSLNEGMDGWCVCNSTTARPVKNLFPNEGGLSGKPLASRSLTLLKKLKNHIGRASDKLIISCGGVMTPEDVLERLDEGAHLVQVYSALVFNGPLFFRSVFKYQRQPCS